MGPVLPAPLDILPDGEGETFNLKEIPKILQDETGGSGKKAGIDLLPVHRV